jgi:DNA adenine methylase
MKETTSAFSRKVVGEEVPSVASVVAPRPFLKWAGGKAQAFGEFRQFIPAIRQDHTYFEPFLGGGAVFFGLRPDSAVLSDFNQALVFTYQAVKDDVETLIGVLGRMPPPETDKEYYAARTRFNRLLTKLSTLDRGQIVTFAALFIWLNHLGYNGLYRVNKKGGFNVPYGYYRRPAIYSPEGLRAANSALKVARIMASDYEAALEGASKGDLAYLDPPYDPVSETARFTSYTSTGFDASEQERLSRVVHDLVDRGCRVVLCNSPSDRIKELYKGYKFERIMVSRAINCVGSRRSAVEELVVIA